MRNRIKDDTPSSITILNNADMKVFMATGDHIQTAITVGFKANF